MNVANSIPVLLLLALLGIALGWGAAIVFFVRRWKKKQEEFTLLLPPAFHGIIPPAHFLAPRPISWVAVRSRNLVAVQSSLGLNSPKPCTWMEGIAGEQKLFIAPPVNGWILILGSGLPDPGDDVDVCFRFLLDLSRQLGQVQYFNANHVLGHHAWVRLEAGRVVRAYAWAGKTLWNQGIKTRAELELGLKCYRYFESPERLTFTQPDFAATNTEKVSLLAAEWSLDPASIDERVFDHACGIAGDPTRAR